MNIEIECLERFEQAEFINVLKYARVFFSMGETRDSPTPIDVLACGVPIVLPERQHKLLNEEFYSMNDERTKVSEDGMLSIVFKGEQMRDQILKGILLPRT